MNYELRIMTTVFLKIVFVVSVSLLLNSLFIIPYSFAAVMSSENYQVDTNVIESGVLQTQGSENFTVEYPWQTTVALEVQTPAIIAETETFVGVSGGIFSTGAGTRSPTHINAFNVPLVISKEQSGRVVYNFPGNLSVTIEIPKEVAPHDITIFVNAEKESVVNRYLIPPASDLRGDAFWNITVQDSFGNPVTQFDTFISITFQIPDILLGVKDLGVYFLDEKASEWVLIEDAVFTEDTVVFGVNHLTKFAIFGRENVPGSIAISTQKEIPVTLEALSSTGEVEVREVDSITPEGPGRIEQLFDINLLLEDIRIENATDLVVRVEFFSFGTVPTLVDLTFVIEDEANNEVYRSVGEITVETEGLFTQTFEGLELPDGMYTVILTTLYSTDVVDEFSSVFEIKLEEKGLIPFWLWILILITVVALYYVLRYYWRPDAGRE